MKLKDAFLTYESDGEHLTVSTGGTEFNGLIRSNNTAAFIVECLKENTTQEQILDKMAEKYDAPKDVMAKDLSRIIDTLNNLGVLDE